MGKKNPKYVGKVGRLSPLPPSWESRSTFISSNVVSVVIWENLQPELYSFGPPECSPWESLYKGSEYGPGLSEIFHFPLALKDPHAENVGIYVQSSILVSTKRFMSENSCTNAVTFKKILNLSPMILIGERRNEYSWCWKAASHKIESSIAANYCIVSEYRE